MPTKMLLGLCVYLCLASASAGLLRVPKVYNAIISSSDNLTPSRAFPLIQPVVHETALGYPLGPILYHQPPSILQQEASGNLNSNGEKGITREAQPKAIEPPKADVSPPNRDEKPPGTSPAGGGDPVTENPLKLNELGLPPSLVPVQQFNPKVTYQYDPYNPYNPYYSDPYGGVLLPYGNPYGSLYGNPYSPYYQPAFSANPFNPYAIPPSFFGAPQGANGERRGAQEPQWPAQEQPWGGPRPQELEAEPRQPAPEQQPPKQDRPGLNIKNNNNKNSDIPDVPPPPLPAGGLKYDSDKKSS